MAKGRKKTKGLMQVAVPGYKPPTPEERVQSAAEHLTQTAVEASSAFKSTARMLAGAARRAASKVVRGSGQPK